MHNFVQKERAVDLGELKSILSGLGGYDIFEVTGDEADGVLQALKLRAAAAAKRINQEDPEARSDSLRDGEVLGLEKDGQVIQWNGEELRPYVSGENVEAFGVSNLNEVEARRVGMTLEKWTTPLEGDADESKGARKAFFEAFDTSEYGGNGPSYAMVLCTPALVSRIRRLQLLCEEMELSEVRVTDGPDRWSRSDEALVGSLQSPELVVSGNSFYFEDRPKHVNYTIQTRAKSIKHFIESLTSTQPVSDPLFFGSNVEALREMVEEDEGEESSA